VKVCGLTDPRDVAVAVGAGADAVGFVNVPASPRFVTLERARELAEGLPTATVLLTVDLDPDAALDALERTGITGIQPYGDHRVATAAAVHATGRLVLFPTHPAPDLDLTGIVGIPLLDTPSTTKLGGTGRSFNWQLAASLKDRFVLAGGLGPQNIVEAISQVRPWGVDASSGLEQAPGRKDHGMVADFLNKAKAT